MSSSATSILSLLLGALALSSQTTAVAARTRPLHKRSPVTIPMRGVELAPDHPLARRQDNYGLVGGPLKHYTIDIPFAGGTTNVIFDTGSADLAVQSGSVPGSGVGNTGSSCTENYGATPGGVSGQIQSANYGLASFSTDGFFCNVQDLPVNGVLGMHYPRSNGPGVSAQTGQNPLSQFQAAGLNSFGIYLDNAPNGGGAFTVNDYEPAFVADGAPFMTEYVDPLNGGYWGVDLTGNYEYEGNSYPIGLSTAIVDTGTTLITLPQAAAQQIWALVGADSTGSYGSNCNPGGDPITFVTAAGNRLDIPAAVYVVRSNGGCINAFRAKSAQAVQNQPSVIFGAAFMRAYYTYFDVANGLLNFAQSSGY